MFQREVFIRVKLKIEGNRRFFVPHEHHPLGKGQIAMITAFEHLFPSGECDENDKRKLQRLAACHGWHSGFLTDNLFIDIGELEWDSLKDHGFELILSSDELGAHSFRRSYEDEDFDLIAYYPLDDVWKGISKIEIDPFRFDDFLSDPEIYCTEGSCAHVLLVLDYSRIWRSSAEDSTKLLQNRLFREVEPFGFNIEIDESADFSYNFKFLRTWSAKSIHRTERVYWNHEQSKWFGYAAHVDDHGDVVMRTTIKSGDVGNIEKQLNSNRRQYECFNDNLK